MECEDSTGLLGELETCSCRGGLEVGLEVDALGWGNTLS